MAAAQTLRVESHNPIKTEHDIPRIDLTKIDNIPYYIESKKHCCNLIRSNIFNYD